jgi:broad specificity phosphatase PhoE
MPRILLIRHGEPETNWGGGDPDPGLSLRGREQAAAAASRLADFGKLAVYSSPMRRCRETAAPYTTAVSRSPIIEPRVSEVVAPPGVTDRRQWLLANFPWQNPSARRAWRELDPGIREWRDTVLEAIHAIREDAAVFTHFIAINAMTGAALGQEHTIVCAPGYASITEIETDGGRLRLIARGAENSATEVR